MKIFKFLSIALFALLTLASCEKEADNIFEPDTSINYAAEVAGNYVGFYTSTTIDSDTEYQVSIARLDNGMIQITGKDFGQVETNIFANRDNSNILHNDVYRYKDITVVYDRKLKELVFTIEENETAIVTFVGDKLK